METDIEFVPTKDLLKPNWLWLVLAGVLGFGAYVILAI